MTSSSPTAWFDAIAMMALPLLYLGLHVFILGACVFGAMQPSLRREFIWFALGAGLGCAGSVITLVPTIMRVANPQSMSSNLKFMSTLYSFSSGIHLLSLLLIAVGFILLALRARSLPVMRH
jgi:hypothetical protein